MSEDNQKEVSREEYQEELAVNTAKLVTPGFLEELKNKVQWVLDNSIEIDDYKRISMDIALRLEKIVGTNRKTLFFLNYKYIHPNKAGRAYKFRQECRDLLEKIEKVKKHMQ